MPTISSRPSDDILEEGNITKHKKVDDNNNETDILFISAYSKPNAIVRPLQRTYEYSTESIQEEQQHQQQNNLNLPIIDENTTQNINGNKRLNVRSQLLKNQYKNNSQQQIDFTKELDAKLKKLQKDKKSSKNGSNNEIQQQQQQQPQQQQIIQYKRPIFITTVPKGIFLQPTRQLPIIARRLYAYASRPRVLHNCCNNNTNNATIINNALTNNNSNNNANYKNQHFIHQHNQHQSYQNITQHDYNEGKLMAKISSSLGSLASSVPGIQFNNGQRDPHLPCQNIMYDKRVVRGSNYTTTHVTSSHWNPHFAYAGLLSGKGEGDCCATDAKRRQMLRKKCIARNQRGIIGTPPPVKGRKHERVQTEKYLEELFERPPEIDVSCQTDLFLHRPPTPPYVPAKTGCDVFTEILEGELFDYDTEVQPILETLVGRSVEQGLVEIMHEEELADMHEQQQKLLAIREAELAELKRLEEQEKRLQAEKERRLMQEEISKNLDREMQERVTAAKLLQGHIAALLPGVLTTIESIVEAENREELERTIGPWLAQEVAQEIGQMIDSRELLEQIVKEIINQRAEIYQAMVKSESTQSADLLEEAFDGEEGEDEGENEALNEYPSPKNM